MTRGEAVQKPSPPFCYLSFRLFSVCHPCFFSSFRLFSVIPLFFVIPAKQAVQKPRKSRTARKTTHWHGKYPPFPRRRESSANRARNAHIRAMAAAGGGASLWLSAAPSPRPEGARSARFLCWIPACAGMAGWGHGNGGVGFIRWMPAGFLHSLESRNPAQIQRGTRTLQNPTARTLPSKEREARAFYAGFRLSPE